MFLFSTRKLKKQFTIFIQSYQDVDVVRTYLIASINIFDFKLTVNKSTSEMENLSNPHLKIKQEYPDQNGHDQEDLKIAYEEYDFKEQKDSSNYNLEENKNAKPFKCPQCSATFTEKWSIKIHIANVHEGKRPFQCSVCQATFQRKTHLKRHDESVHQKIKAFECSICNLKFARKANWKRHFYSAHKGIKREDVGAETAGITQIGKEFGFPISSLDIKNIEKGIAHIDGKNFPITNLNIKKVSHENYNLMVSYFST